MKFIRPKLLIFVILSILQLSNCSDLHKFQIINNHENSTWEFISHTYQPSLYEFNTFHKYCRSGTWIHYRDRNYREPSGWATWLPSCLTANFVFTYNSIRFAGIPHQTNARALNLYEGIWMTGDERLFVDDVPKLGFSFSAVALTGDDSDVTFYEEENYNGKSICIPHSLPHASKMVNNIKDLEPNFGKAKSLRFTPCTDDNRREVPMKEVDFFDKNIKYSFSRM